MSIDRQELAARVKLAAEWFVNAQCRMQRPYWDANHGRFPYNRHILTGTTVWGLNWSCARGIMVLIAADRLAPDDRYMEAARAAAEYLEILQILDARRKEDFGAIREEVPQSRRYNIRDQAEAASALLYLGVYLGEERLVESARLWADWYLKYAVDRKTGWPFVFREADGTWKPGDIYFLAANGIFMHQLGKHLGKQRYVEEGLVRNAEYGITHLFDQRGALAIEGSWSQHAGGDHLVLNEDGACIALVAAARVTGQQKFRDKVLGHLDVVMGLPLPLPIFSGMGSTLMVAAEAARVWDYQPAREYIAKALPHLLALQITEEQFAERGALIGEDEDPKWYSGGAKRDYVTTRATAYGALALAKIEGTVVTGGYSSDAELPVRAGKWERKP